MKKLNTVNRDMKDVKVGMRRVTLNRNGQVLAKVCETSDLKIGSFAVGEHVMLAITGDCCYGRRVFSEYVVEKVERIERFGGRDRVTFTRASASN